MTTQSMRISAEQGAVAVRLADPLRALDPRAPGARYRPSAAAPGISTTDVGLRTPPRPEGVRVVPGGYGTPGRGAARGAPAPGWPPAQADVLPEPPGDDLQADRQAGRGQAGGHADGRQVDQVGQHGQRHGHAGVPGAPATSVGIGPSAANAGTDDIGVSSTSMSSNSAATCGRAAAWSPRRGPAWAASRRWSSASRGRRAGRARRGGPATAPGRSRRTCPRPRSGRTWRCSPRARRCDRRASGRRPRRVLGGRLGPARPPPGRRRRSRGRSTTPPAAPRPVEPARSRRGSRRPGGGRQVRSRSSGPAITSSSRAVSATVVVSAPDDGVLGQVGDAEGGDAPVAALAGRPAR